ncbi:MAG: beta strand repeat-containing protein [Candidatus Spyradenecus sp.]
MRTITRLALAALAAVCASSTLVAAPAASWTNFGGGITNDDGTITYYGGNTAYAATAHGSRQTDGSVLLTEGGIEIVLPSAQAQVSVIVDMSAPPETGDYDILAVDTGTYTMAARSKSRTLNLLYITNSNSNETDRTSNGGTAVWGDAERRWVTMTHQNNLNGTSVYLDDAAAAPNDSGLRWSSQSISKVKIGAAGQKIYAIYLYTTRLTQADIATARAENTAALAVPLSFTFSRAGLTSAGNTMEVLQVGGGAAKGLTFTATLGTNATRVTEGSETDETAFFKSVTSGSTLLTTNGYPMVQCKFSTTGSKDNEGWSIYLPFTPSAETTVTRVCPQLFAVNASGNVQSDSKVFGYTVTLYSGSVDETTVSSATALATATGTTDSLTQTLVNTQAAAFADKVTLNADTAYTMKLAVSDSSTGGGSYSGIGGVVFSSVIGRTVSGEGTWSNDWTAGSAPADGSAVELTVSDAATLSMDAAASLSSLTVLDGSADSSASLTFSGEQSLTSSATTLNVSTDVSAITASLGAVTLAGGKTLTVGKSSSIVSLSGTGGTVSVDATAESIAYDATATMLEIYRTYGGKVIFKGANANGVTLPYAIGKGTMAAKFAFDGGTHTFQYGVNSSQVLFGPQGTDADPTLDILDGATLNFCTKDLSGWTPQTNAEKVILRVRAGSTLNFTQYSSNTAYFNNRIVLDNNATVNIQNTNGNFRVNGGVRAEGTAQLAMLGGETETAADVTGNNITLASDQTPKGMGVSVGENATLTIANAIVGNSGCTFAKYGAGTLVLSGTFTASPITVAAGVLGFSVASGERTVGVNISGSGTVKKLGAGTLSLTGTVSTPVEVAEGTLDLGTQRSLTLGGIAEGATLKLTATDVELANCAITFSTTMGTAPAKERFTVVKADGTAVTLTAEPTVADGTLTVTLPQSGGMITATGNWSEAGVSGETVVYVRGGESAESAITVTLDADLSGYTQIAVIGHVKFVTTETQATLPTTIALESGTVLTVTASFSGAYTIPSGATVVLDGTTAITSASALTVNGALKTQGTVTLSGANAVPAGGTLTVETGTLTLTASDRSLAGTVNIAAGATLVNVTGDALKYDGSPVVNVRGTLDMRSTRWTVGSANTLNVYAGATIQGAGDSHGALDFYNSATHTLNVPNEGDASQPVTISAKLRLRQSGVTLKFNIALGSAKVNLTGIVRDVGSLEKAGSGSSRLILSGENKVYTGATTVTTGYLDLVGGCTLATSGVTVASGAAVTFQADDASTETTYTTPFALTGRMDKEGAHSVILSGAITGAGAVNVKNGGLTLDASAATAEAPTAVANPIAVGLDSGTAGTLTAKGFLTLSNASNTVKATGTLAIASGTTVLTTAGSAGGIKGKLAIASGATLQCGIDDAPDYNGSPSFEIAGTLEITGTARWSIPSGATVTLHEGALLKGTGPESGSNYAFDFFDGGAITADGNATIEATVGAHKAGQTLTLTQTAETMTTITGEVRNSTTLKAAGTGTVVYAPAAGVAATSSPLVVDTGATLQLLPAAAFTLNGTVTGAGTLMVGNGTAATAVTLAVAGNGANVTVSPKASLTVATGAGSEDANKSFADGKTVTNNGTLTLTSGYGYFNIAGTGKTVVPGSDFLFGIGGASAETPFSNGLEVPASANFRIRPWNRNWTLIAMGTAAVNGSVSVDGGDHTVTLQIAADTTLTGSSTFAIPVAFENAATATMASDATFTFSNALTVPKNVTLPGTVTLGENAVLSGAGELSGTVTLSAGVIINATESTASGYLKLTGTVTLGDTLKVRAAKLTNVLDVPTAAGLDLAKVSLTDDSTVPTGAKLMTSVFTTESTSVTTLKFFVPPMVPEAPAESPREADVDTQIAQAAETYAGWGMVISEVTAITGTGSDGTGTREINGASLFENVLTLAPAAVKDDGTYTATATVAYDFGLSAMTVKSAQLGSDTAARNYVVLCAKVSNGTDTGDSAADYGTTTTVSLLLGGKVCDGTAGNGPAATELTDEQLTALGLTRGKGEKWFAVPMADLATGTSAFTVRASQTTATP